MYYLGRCPLRILMSDHWSSCCYLILTRFLSIDVCTITYLINARELVDVAVALLDVTVESAYSHR